MFGVVLREPDGTAYYYFDEYKKRVFKNLGVLSVSPDTGRIVAWPLRGLSDFETRKLIGAAEKAFREPPTKATGWRFCRKKTGNYWMTYVATPVDPEGDTVAEAVMTTVHHETAQQLTISQQIAELASSGTQADAIADGVA